MDNLYDFVIIGSGFGGSVAAMRLAEKGYRVLVVERGKRFRDPDFPSTNRKVWKYLWVPAARSLPALSPRLGENVRTNSEALLGASRRGGATDFSQGIAITSIFYADPTMTVEPARFPAGSALAEYVISQVQAREVRSKDAG